MKILSLNRMESRRTGAAAFTLAEMLIAMTIFTMVIGAMVATQLFGLRVYTLAATKLSATAGGRKALNLVRDQIRQAKTLNVGICNSTPGSFNPLGLTNYQVGNALMVYPTTNQSVYTCFYLNTTTTTNCQLWQYTVASNAANTSLVVTTNMLAGYITNQDIFTAQDYNGNTLTNENQNDNGLESIPNRLVISMKMQFWQWEYPIAQVGVAGGVNMYDFYQLRTKITRRTWN
ncbi:MAG: prepilin-type N-terminal cleavage/methylation domain-containing protein [Verrucomicrobiia bacterium]